ncbi:hypothetical protein R6Q59_014907 [Mikania micrantha]
MDQLLAQTSVSSYPKSLHLKHQTFFRKHMQELKFQDLEDMMKKQPIRGAG